MTGMIDANVVSVTKQSQNVRTAEDDKYTVTLLSQRSHHPHFPELVA